MSWYYPASSGYIYGLPVNQGSAKGHIFISPATSMYTVSTASLLIGIDLIDVLFS